MDPNKKRNSSSHRSEGSASPKRRDTINLAQEMLPVRRDKGGIQKVTADDLINENLIRRAISERSYRDIVDLYWRLDAEEAMMPARTVKRPTGKQIAEIRSALAQILSNQANGLLQQRSELLDLGVAQLEEGELKVNSDLKRRYRQAPR